MEHINGILYNNLKRNCLKLLYEDRKRSKTYL